MLIYIDDDRLIFAIVPIADTRRDRGCFSLIFILTRIDSLPSDVSAVDLDVTHFVDGTF